MLIVSEFEAADDPFVAATPQCVRGLGGERGVELARRRELARERLVVESKPKRARAQGSGAVIGPSDDGEVVVGDGPLVGARGQLDRGVDDESADVVRRVVAL